MEQSIQCCEDSSKNNKFNHKIRSSLSKVVNKVGSTKLLIAGLFLTIAVFIPSYLADTVRFTLNALLSILPYLLVSVIIAAYLKAAGADKIIAKVFSGHPISIILAASIFGALSPFCSCGVIPLIAALLVSGVPLSAVTAFWLSSPVMSPDMFVLTAGTLGMEFAVAKTIAAILIGLAGGFGTMFLQRYGTFVDPLKKELASDHGCSATTDSRGGTNWSFWKEQNRREVFRSDFWKTGFFLLQWLIFAFILESLMVKYLPPETISRLMDPKSVLIIPLAAVIGVPAYLNGYAAIPVASGLIGSGFTPGAVLTFMTAGAMTSIPAAIAVFSLVRRSVFAWYIFLSLTGAILVGFTYQVYLW